MQSAKGPNTLNMYQYMQGEDDQQEYMDDEGTSSRPNIDVKAIEDQFDNFVKQMQKYDQILSDVAKNIEEIDGERQFITDFYPKFIWESTYEEDQEKKIVANTDPQLAKIMQNLQRSNKMLKDDMRAWVLEFAKTAKNTQVLIKENKILRQSIALKNKEIVKLIQGIGEAQNQEITELVQNLDLLKEENGVLKEHLSKLKQQVEDKQQEEKRIQAALEKTQSEFNTLEKAKNDAEDEEEHLSKTFSLIEQWRVEADKRRKKLEKQKQYLVYQRKQYEEEKDKIEKELQLCKRQKEQLETGLKKKCYDSQGDKNRMLHQIEDLGEAISKAKDQSKYLDDETNKNANKKIQFQKLNRQYTKRVNDAEEKLKERRAELEKSQQTEVGLDCQIELQKYDIDLLKKEVKDLQEKQKGIHEQWNKVMKRNEQNRDKELGEWQTRVNQNQRQLAMKILQERSKLSTQQKQLQRWQQKVYEKKEQLSDLKLHMKEIKDNQMRLAELKAKLGNQQLN